MVFANNGAALIGDVVVPPSEVKVLSILSSFDQPATVQEISRAMEGAFSDASLYSLLGRLSEKRRLVDRFEVVVDVRGTALRRVTWMARPVATAVFKKGSYEFKKSERSARSVAQALG